MRQIRNAAIARCPELKICRVIAISGKHYQVDHDPDDSITTLVYHSFARRESEDFARPYMFLAIKVHGERHPITDIFKKAIVFWEDLWAEASPGGRDYSKVRQTRGW